MPDDFNFSDDDSLIPDWMRDEFSADEPASDTPPWDRRQGDPPPAPPGRSPSAPPWEKFAGQAVPPPTTPGVTPPWGESAASLPDDSAWLDDTFDWDTSGQPEAGAPSGEVPRGMTERLPWREEAQPPADQPRSPIRRIGAAGEQPSAEDAGFGEVSSAGRGALPGEEDDMAWLTGGEPAAGDLEALIFDESRPPARSEADDFESMFAAEPGEPEPPIQPETSPAVDDLEALFADEFPEAEEPQEEEDLAWMDDDLGSLPVLSSARAPEPPEPTIPAWMKTALEAEESAEEAASEYPEAEYEEEEPPRGPIRRIAPAAEEPPRRPIRRIAPSEEQPAEPEADEAEEADMQSWLAGVDTGAEEEMHGEMDGLTYEEWEQEQANREREARKTEEERLLEQGPDWFSQLTQAPAGPPSGQPPKDKGPEFVPDWFLGLEEQKEEEAPDWFKQLDFSADALTAPAGEPTAPKPAAEEPPAPSTPEWFSGAALPGFDDAEWQAAFGVPQPSADEPSRGPIRRISRPAEEPPPVEEPAGETGPGMPTGEELPPEEEFALPDFDQEPEAAGRTDEWMSDSMWEMPETPQALAEEPRVPLDEFELPDLDLEPEAGGEIAQVPDWLSETLGEVPSPAADEFPLPDSGAPAGYEEGYEEEAIEPGVAPEWLTAGQDMRAAPDEVPFPEIDLDQTMPTEQAFDAELGEPEAEMGEPEEWMSDFEPAESAPGAMQRPLPPEEEAAEDFVERFEPDLVQPAPIDGEAPAWLREMADEGRLGEIPLSTAEAAADQLPAEETLDWLSEISAEDVIPEAPAPEMPPRPDTSIPALEPGVLQTAPLDSRAIDELLGLYVPPSEPEPEFEEPEWEPETAEPILAALESLEAPPEAAEPAPSFEIGGVADLEWMPEGEAGGQVPDLESLFDEGQAEELFPPEAVPPSGERVDQLPAMPEAAPRFQPRKPEPEPEPEIPQEAQPEWLAEMRPSDLPVPIKAGGAETSIKQKQVIELPERLRSFRDTAMREIAEVSDELAPVSAEESGPLAGIAGALPAADLILEAAARPVEGLVITREQQDRLNRLQALLSTVAAEEEELEEERAQVAGIEPLELEGLVEGEKPAPAPRRARRRRRLKVDRVIVGLVLLAALIVPFGTDALHIASDPPALEEERLAAASVVDTVAAGQYVLFAFEYGPTAAGELDPLAEAVLRDVLTQGAIPLTISTDPAGAFHAQAVFEPLIEDAALLAARGQGETALEEGQDYVLLRYLAGEAVGVRSLHSTHTDADGNLKQHLAFKTDLRGDETGLPIGSIEQDIALIVVVGAESGAVRTWAEQLEGVDVPKIALVAAAIEPLTIPYINQDGYAGYLAGVRDTYSYNAARNTTNRTPYVMPGDVPVDVPNPEESRWHSMALGAAVAAVLITLGMVINLFRGITRRQR